MYKIYLFYNVSSVNSVVYLVLDYPMILSNGRTKKKKSPKKLTFDHRYPETSD